MEKPADSGQGNKHSKDRNKTDDDQTLFVNRAESTTEAALTMAAKGEVSADCGDPPKSGPLVMLVCGPKKSPDH